VTFKERESVARQKNPCKKQGDPFIVCALRGQKRKYEKAYQKYHQQQMNHTNSIITIPSEKGM